MTINRTEYIGFGIIYAPKTYIANGSIVINFLIWELQVQW